MQDIIPPPKKPTLKNDDEVNKLIQQKIAEKKEAAKESDEPKPVSESQAVGGVVKPPWWRRLITGFLVLLVVSASFGLNIAVWANHTLLNTDNFVATFSPLADNPKVQEKITNAVTDKIINAAPPQELAAKLLPDAKAGQTDQQLKDALRPAISGSVSTAVKSPHFTKAWRDALTTVHGTIVNNLHGKSDPIEVKLTPILNEVLDSFSGTELGFIADEQRSKILEDQNVNLKIDDTKSLGNLKDGVDIVKSVYTALILVVAIGFVLLLALSPYRFRSARKVLFLVGLEALLLAIVIMAGKKALSSNAPADVKGFAEPVVSRLFSGLISQSLMIGIGLLVVWLIAYLLHRTKLSRIS